MRKLVSLACLISMAGCSCWFDSAVEEQFKNLKIVVRSVGAELKPPPSPPALLLGLVIENTNARMVEVQKMDYTVHLDGEEFYRGKYPSAGQTISVGEQGSVAIDVSIPLTPQHILTLSQIVMQGPDRQPQCTVKGKIHMKTPIGTTIVHDFKTDNVLVEVRELEFKVKLPPGFKLPIPPGPGGIFPAPPGDEMELDLDTDGTRPPPPDGDSDRPPQPTPEPVPEEEELDL